MFYNFPSRYELFLERIHQEYAHLLQGYRPDLGKDPDRHALTMEQFTNLIEVLKLSKHMNSPISQRGKGSMTHGKGKRKRK